MKRLSKLQLQKRIDNLDEEAQAMGESNRVLQIRNRELEQQLAARLEKINDLQRQMNELEAGERSRVGFHADRVRALQERYVELLKVHRHVVGELLDKL
jgi:regulator of replication initiation timing